MKKLMYITADQKNLSDGRTKVPPAKNTSHVQKNIENMNPKNICPIASIAGFDDEAYEPIVITYKARVTLARRR